MEQSNTYLGDYFGHWQNQALSVGLKDRLRHCYLIGQTGTGKSTLLHAMATQDIHQGRGVAVIDPHGTLAHKIAASVPKERINDVIYCNVTDTARPLGINPLFGADRLNNEQRAKRAANILSALKGIYGYSWGVELERVLLASLLALLDAPTVRPTLLSVLKLIENETYRDQVTPHIKNQAALGYFHETLEAYRAGEFEQKASSTTNKIFQIVANPMVANIFGQYRPSFDFQKAMHDQKILLFDFSQSALGEHFCHLMCALTASEIITAAVDRATPDTFAATSDGEFTYNVPPFMLFIDEFQKAHSDVFSGALSEARKYNLSLTLAHQFLDQIDPQVSNAVLGNVGTTIAFRVSGKDADLLARYDGECPPSQFRDLATGQALARATVNGKPQSSAEIVTTPLPHYSTRRAERIKNVSRYRYGRTRHKVEAAISRELGTAKKKQVVAQVSKPVTMRRQRKKLNQLIEKQRKNKRK